MAVASKTSSLGAQPYSSTQPARAYGAFDDVLKTQKASTPEQATTSNDFSNQQTFTAPTPSTTPNSFSAPQSPATTNAATRPRNFAFPQTSAPSSPATSQNNVLFPQAAEQTVPSTPSNTFAVPQAFQPSSPAATPDAFAFPQSFAPSQMGSTSPSISTFGFPTQPYGSTNMLEQSMPTRLATGTNTGADMNNGTNYNFGFFGSLVSALPNQKEFWSVACFDYGSPKGKDLSANKFLTYSFIAASLVPGMLIEYDQLIDAITPAESEKLQQKLDDVLERDGNKQQSADSNQKK